MPNPARYSGRLRANETSAPRRLEPAIVCEVDDNHAAGAKFLDDLEEVWPITYPLDR
jgi:hypothetical protein